MFGAGRELPEEVEAYARSNDLQLPPNFRYTFERLDRLGELPELPQGQQYPNIIGGFREIAVYTAHFTEAEDLYDENVHVVEGHHQQQIHDAIFGRATGFAPAVDRLFWDECPLAGFCSVELEIFGIKESDTQILRENDYYKRTFYFASGTGRFDLQEKIAAWLLGFSTLGDLQAIGSDTDVSIHLRHVKMTLIGERQPRGARDSPRASFKSNVKWVSEECVLMDVPYSFNRYRRSRNDCFFRCIAYMIKDSSYLYEHVFRMQPKTTRKHVGIEHNQGLTVEEALRCATAMDIEIEIAVLTGGSRKLMLPTGNGNEFKKRQKVPLMRFDKLVLDEADGHYYMLASGKLTEKSKTGLQFAKYFCKECGTEQSVGDWFQHERDHIMAKEHFMRQQAEARARIAPIVRQPNESLIHFGNRYRDHYADIVERYVDQSLRHPQNGKLLWLSGPGGCGKSFVLGAIEQRLKQKGWEDEEIGKVAFTGKAAEAIGGCTIDRFFNSFNLLGPIAKTKQAKSKANESVERIKKLKLLVLEEISMITKQYFEKMDSVLRQVTGVEKPFGGIPVILMGDFLQLPPISETGEDFEWCFAAATFKSSVVPISMGHGFRFLKEGEEEKGRQFFEFLLDIRMGLLDKDKFMNLGFKVLTPVEWGENFTMETRPTCLAFKKKTVQEMQTRADKVDLQNRNNVLIPIPTRSILATTNEEFIGTPIHPTKLESRIAKKLLGTENFFCEDRPPSGLESFTITSNPDEGIFSSDSELFWRSRGLFQNQNIMVLRNYCGRKEDGTKARGLSNGSMVQFLGVRDDALIVADTKTGEQWLIPPETRYLRRTKDEFIIVTGYPIQASAAYTVHKAQGASLDRVAYYVPSYKKNKKLPPHIFYTAISRARDPDNVYFIVDSTNEYRKANWKDPTVQRNRRQNLWQHLKSLTGLHVVNETAVRIMKAANRGILDVPDEVLIAAEDHASSYQTYLPYTINGLQFWNAKIPRTFPRTATSTTDNKDLEREKQFLLHNTLIFDVETGAAVSTANHSVFFDQDGNWISDSNTARLKQAWWLVGAVYYRDGKVVWCHEHPELYAFIAYQQEDGTMRFHHGYLDRKDLEDDHWCEKIFFRYLLALISLHSSALETKIKRQRRKNFRVSSWDRSPIKICGFNIDSFDILGVLKQFTESREWIAERLLPPVIVPGAGASVTSLQMRKYLQGNKITTVAEIHDMFRVLGQVGGLDKSHKSYAVPSRGTDKWYEAIDYFGDTARKHAETGLELGKGAFPHMLTQREGVFPTLVDDDRILLSDDFTVKDRGELEKNPAMHVQNLYTACWDYMIRDLFATLALYICFDISTREQMELSVLKFNTAQQLTTARFLIHTVDQSKKMRSYADNIIESDKLLDDKRLIFTKLPVYSAEVNEFIKSAIYGGKTLPRVRYWESKDIDADYYLKGDIGGMYAAAQEFYPYPYGAYFFRPNDPRIQELVKAQWRKARELHDPRFLAFPSSVSPFPHMFIATVQLRWPSLCVEPGVAYKRVEKNGKQSLIWGICDTDDKGNPLPRIQTLTNVDLAIAMRNGAVLLDVYGVLYWSSHGHILKDYVATLNTEKYETKDDGVKNFAKLCANAFYGACLKQDNNSTLGIHRFPTEASFWKAVDKMARVTYRQVNKNGTMSLQGELKAEPDYVSSRSTSLGAFVLAYSHWDLDYAVGQAYGPVFNPKKRSEVREALQHQILYGDTDSLYLHKTHVMRILTHDRERPEKAILFEDDHDHPKRHKLGKFADEEQPDAKEYKSDFANGQHVRITRFASNAPKSYTHQAMVPNHFGQWKPKYKAKCKGVPGNKAMATLVAMDESEVPEHLQGSVRFTEGSEDLHNYMFEAIKSDNLRLETRTTQQLKKMSLAVNQSERYMDSNQTVHKLSSYDLTATCLNRNVCSDSEVLKWQGRRTLTDREARYLDFDEEDVRRIYVPIGWNYDGRLFELSTR